MKHKHRILPGHMGGEYVEGNVIQVEVTKCDGHTANHVMWHFANWQLHGLIEDFVAYRCLSGYYGKEEIIDLLLKEGRRRAHGEEARKKAGETLKRKFEDNPDLRVQRSQEILKAFEIMDQESPGWREELGYKIKESGGPQRSVQTRRDNKVGMFNPEWQREMAGRAGRSNARNGTGFCNPEVQRCPIRKARGGRASALSRQGLKIGGVKLYPDSFEYRSHLSSDFVSYYVHFGIEKG